MKPNKVKEILKSVLETNPEEESKNKKEIMIPNLDGTYVMKAVCVNCDEKWTTIVKKGHTTEQAGKNLLCRYCGCNTVILRPLHAIWNTCETFEKSL